MMSSKRLLTAVCGALALTIVVSQSAFAAGDLYAPPGAAKLKAAALKWAGDQKGAPANSQQQVEKIWADADSDSSPRVLFAKVIETFAAVNPDARKLIGSLSLLNAPLTAPDAKSLAAGGSSRFYSANMRLYYARYLTQRKMYDEALAIFNGFDVKRVADPATYLFFKSVCEHQLLKQREGLVTLNKLLKNTESVPLRYSNVASLMQYDLQKLKDKSLKSISLKMRDSGRRLELARGGQRVQRVQKEIIADLDALIKKLEQQGGS